MNDCSLGQPARLPRRLGTGWVIAAGVLLTLTTAALAVINLKPQTDAPGISLKDSTGAQVDTAKMRGRILVVIFGELYHDKTRQVCKLLDAILHDSNLIDEPIAPLLIVTQEFTAEDLKKYADDKLPATILRDANRQAFGAYEVAVMPSVVVIDKQGRVVHAMAGLTSRFSDILTDSLRFAAGKLSAAQFEQTLHPQPATATAASEASMRADRLAQLARQLALRGLDDMAAEKYAEALKLDPHHSQVHMGLGKLYLKRRRLADAEKHFRAVLAIEPGSIDAMLGVAFVQTLRGGSETVEAERTARAILANNPSHPRAYFLLGLIQEGRGEAKEAAASFKKAAQLLLERVETEQLMDAETPVNLGRRTFCKACIGGMATASAAMVVYPIVSFLTPAEQLGGNKPLEIPLDRVGVGQAEYLEFRGQQVIVLGGQEGPLVFSASCPHLGCSVMWESANGVFRCPCHGAVFNATGKVIKGPVSASLEKIPFEVKDGKIIVS